MMQGNPSSHASERPPSLASLLGTKVSWRSVTSPPWLDRLLGEEGSFSLEHRLSNGLMLIIVAATLGAAGYDLFFEAEASGLVVEVLAAAGLVYMGLYAWSRSGRSFLVPAWLSLSLLVLAFYPAIWVSSRGFDGHAPLVGLGVFVAVACVFSGWRRNLMLSFALLVTLGLFLADYHQLLRYPSYETRSGHYLDVFATLMQLAVPTVVGILGMRASYHLQHLKTREYAARLEETNQRLEDALKQNQELALTDELTHLPNRRHFQDALERKISEAARYRRALSIAIVDIDHFKSINDTYGHAIGDRILSALGAVLSGHLRQSDLCARWGGEEFVLLCPETPVEGIFILTERLRAMVEGQTFSGGITVTISIGIAGWQKNDTGQKLFDRADKALYAAKRQGRNRVIEAGPDSRQLAGAADLALEESASESSSRIVLSSRA